MAAGIAFFSITEYSLHKRNYNEHLDEKLRVAAYMTNTLLTPEFHDRAVDAQSIDALEYTRNIERLSEVAKALDVIYIYTMVEREGKIYFTASNATDDERKTGINLTTYFEHYEEPSEELLKVFATQKSGYGEYSDKWGSFRSFFLPRVSPQGNFYVVAADIETTRIEKELKSALFDLIFRLFIAILFVVPLVVLYLRKVMNEQHYYLSNFDALTKLPNKKQLEQYAEYMLSLAHRNDNTMALLLIDINRFKQVNDSLGHKSGDLILARCAKRLQKLVRGSDIVGRFGADQFVVFCSISDSSGAQALAQKILAVLAEPYEVNQDLYTLTSSIGIALYPQDGTDFETLMKSADTALLEVKSQGQNGYRFITAQMQQHSKRYLQLSHDLHRAIAKGELSLRYQPQVETLSGKLIGAEALLRWHHRDLGEISPSEFIPIAEENGLIIEIGEWVLRESLKQIKEWNEAYGAELVMAINLSAVQFRHPLFIDKLNEIIETLGVKHDFIELEITESIAMHDTELAIEIVESLYNEGIRIAIDDFGTGYSLLSYLKQFKVYKLKIDQSFVRELCINTQDRSIVSAIINMAHSLGFKTIAEGVEREEQLGFLKAEGCDEIQGYYFSKPLSASEFEAFWKSWKSKYE